MLNFVGRLNSLGYWIGVRFFSILLLASGPALGKSSFSIEEIELICSPLSKCSSLEDRLKDLKRSFESIRQFRETLPLFLSDPGLKSVAYQLIQRNDVPILRVKVSWAKIIGAITHSVHSPIETKLDELIKPITSREGDYYGPQGLSNSVVYLENALKDRGFPLAKVGYDVKGEDELKIHLSIATGPPSIADAVEVEAKSQLLKSYLRPYFTHLLGMPLNLTATRELTDQIRQDLEGAGYYKLNLRIVTEPLKKAQGRKKLIIKASNETIFSITQTGLPQQFSRSFIREELGKLPGSSPGSALETKLTKKLIEGGYLDAEVNVKESSFEEKNGQSYHQFAITFAQGKRYRLDAFEFVGNQFFDESELIEKLSNLTEERLGGPFFQRSFVKELESFLEKLYVEKGFLLADASSPIIYLDKKNKTARVEYKLIEGPRCRLTKIHFEGFPKDLSMPVGWEMKKDAPFNPLKLTEQINSLEQHIREQGYLFFQITNKGEQDLLSYSNDYSSAEMTLKGNGAKKLFFGRFMVSGAEKTAPIVYRKYLQLEEGDVLSFEKLDEIETSLESLGIFRNVEVSPIRYRTQQTKTDVLIELSERKGGILELAPGYRTDLGIKLSGLVAYKNIGGLNREVGLKGLVNQRLSEDVFSTIDPRRRAQSDEFLEYNLTLDYLDNDILDSFLDYSATASVSRRRFFNFDADINRIRNTLAYDFGPNFSVALAHQLEEITQFNALSETNEGYFRIGSLGPSFILDFRNNRINPTKGAFFNLSTELASPAFLSQQRDDFIINYYKLVLRNRFYVPLPNGVLAFYVAAGVQKNQSQEVLTRNGQTLINDNGLAKTRGNIPSIKVFRLAGTDIVRGYDDREINTLSVPNSINSTGRINVADYVVQNTAFLTNVKVEPRFFINDDFMMGVFYDAGRIQVDSYDPFSLRQAVGLSLKVLTPVGSLDFDYGLKLNRRQLPDGSAESPGRLHISIGFF